MPIAGVDSNYDSVVGEPWDVGSGSEELNGTFDMMGNVWEWMESPYYNGDYGIHSIRGVRGGAYNFNVGTVAWSGRRDYYPTSEDFGIGFRVASEVPEPMSVALLSLGGVALLKRKRG